MNNNHDTNKLFDMILLTLAALFFFSQALEFMRPLAPWTATGVGIMLTYLVISSATWKR